MSHTSTVKVLYKKPEAFGLAAVAIGGTILGYGVHRLFETKETGYGVRLKDWNYPVVLRENQTLAYDDYNGCWGNVEDLDLIKEHYTLEVAREAALSQGWYCENNEVGELVIYHPDGGTLTVNKAGVVDATNFQGTGCLLAGNLISEAMGTIAETRNKPEMFYAEAQITVSE